MQWPPLWAHLFRMREGIRDWRMKRQCCGLPYHSFSQLTLGYTVLYAIFQWDLIHLSPSCHHVGGHKYDKDRWFTIERVYCIKHVRLVGVLLSKCVADRCLLNIYSGLTQGQGHTVRQVAFTQITFAITETIFGIVLFTSIWERSSPSLFYPFCDGKLRCHCNSRFSDHCEMRTRFAYNLQVLPVPRNYQTPGAINCDLINQVKPRKHFWWYLYPWQNGDPHVVFESAKINTW